MRHIAVTGDIKLGHRRGNAPRWASLKGNGSVSTADWRFDARMGFADMDGQWAFLITGQNLTDEEYLTLSVDAPVQPGSHIGTLGDPRYINGTFRFFF